jgi:galactokinase
MTDIRDDVREGFRQRFDREPHGVWSAPGRVNLIGEHTDYNQGFVFPFAIDRRTVIALAPRDDDRIRLASSFSEEVVEARLADLTGERIAGWQAYPLGVAWALGQRGADLAAVPGFDVFIDSDVPVGAGLSSSAALEGSIALALDDIWRLGLDRPTLAAVGQLAENEIVGAPTGIMDQSASLLGRQDAGVFLDCRSLDAEVIPLGLEAAGLTIAVIDTHVAHAHADGGYRARRESCETGLDDETFRRVRHIVTENQRVLDTVRALREEGPRAIGELLDASHRSMRDDFEISVPELDLAVEVAQNEGAIGARMTGGGFGGSAIALIDVDSLSRLQVAIDGAFAEHGYTGPTVFTVTPSDGAKAEQ